jgi:CRISPR-associated protein Cmr6
MARRAALYDTTPEPATHAGLWLDRYLEESAAQDDKQRHLDLALSEIRVPAGYRHFFARWKAALQGLPNTLLARAQVTGRLIVGLGAESVLETSITLHRTYGVPYLPGSALKGLAAAAAHRQLADHSSWRKTGSDGPIGESHQVLFGDTKVSGYVTFHDALWIPEETGTRLPLDPDVLTVHHPGYYGGEDVPPADWDSPLPVPFVSARGSYLLAWTGPPVWTQAAYDILKEALAKDGLGAKTAAGYGRFKVESIEDTKAEAETPPRPSPPAPLAPAPARPFRQGERIWVKVVEIQSANHYLVEPEDAPGHRVPLHRGGLGWGVGDRKKVKVVTVTPSGRITTLRF